jgi:hypothetical protein
MIDKDFIKVGGAMYALIQHDVNWTYEHDVFGSCDSNKLQIHIATIGVPRDVIRNTLVHEILHSLYREYDISDEDNEETTVTRLANGMCQVTMDNPWILKV